MFSINQDLKKVRREHKLRLEELLSVLMIDKGTHRWSEKTFQSKVSKGTAAAKDESIATLKDICASLKKKCFGGWKAVAKTLAVRSKIWQNKMESSQKNFISVNLLAKECIFQWWRHWTAKQVSLKYSLLPTQEKDVDYGLMGKAVLCRRYNTEPQPPRDRKRTFPAKQRLVRNQKQKRKIRVRTRISKRDLEEWAIRHPRRSVSNQHTHHFQTRWGGVTRRAHATTRSLEKTRYQREHQRTQKAKAPVRAWAASDPDAQVRLPTPPQNSRHLGRLESPKNSWT